MTSDLTKFFGNKICRWLAGNAMPTAPVACYLAVFDGDPKLTGVEKTTVIKSGGRLPITWDTITAGLDNTLASTTDVDFGDSEGACSLSHTACFDAASGGNMLAAKIIPGGPLAILVGTGVKFVAGDITYAIGS